MMLVYLGALALLAWVGWWIRRTWLASETGTREAVARELLLDHVEGPFLDARRRRIEVPLASPEPSGTLRFTDPELWRRWRRP